jgi:hypothetical protein
MTPEMAFADAITATSDTVFRGADKNLVKMAEKQIFSLTSAIENVTMEVLK